MKIELEYDETQYVLHRLYPPDSLDVHPNHRLTQWRAWVRKTANGANGLSWYGDGPTPQAAYDKACATLEERLAAPPQPRYNISTGPKQPLDIGQLDLSFLGDLSV